jgi:hypothetical protein
MKDMETHCQEILHSLREAVTEALDTKRRLGQYAVIVENGQPRRIPAEQIESLISAAKTK